MLRMFRVYSLEGNLSLSSFGSYWCVLGLKTTFVVAKLFKLWFLWLEHEHVLVFNVLVHVLLLRE